MSVSRSDVALYLDGLIDDSQWLREIERAIEQDAQVAAWYREACTDVAPSAAALEAVAEQFAAVERSVWAPIHRGSAAPIAAACYGGTVRPVPEDESIRVQLTQQPSRSAADVALDRLPPSLAPASVAVVRAHSETVVLGPVREARAGGRGPARLSLSDDGQGARWLEPGVPDCLVLRCELRRRRLPLPRGSYRLAWTDAKGEQRASGVFDLRKAPLPDTIELKKGRLDRTEDGGFEDGQGARPTDAVLWRAELPLAEVPARVLEDGGNWSLTLTLGALQDAERLTAQQLRETAPAQLTIWPLVPVATETGSPPFRFEALRHLAPPADWTAAETCLLVRFEPCGGQARAGPGPPAH